MLEERKHCLMLEETKYHLMFMALSDVERKKALSSSLLLTEM